MEAKGIAVTSEGELRKLCRVVFRQQHFEIQVPCTLLMDRGAGSQASSERSNYARRMPQFLWNCPSMPHILTKGKLKIKARDQGHRLAVVLYKCKG